MSQDLQLASTNLFGGALFGWSVVGVNAGTGKLWPCLYDIASSSWSMAFLASSVNIGAGAGAICCGPIMERIGRTKVIKIGIILSACTFLSAFAAPSYALQLVWRVLTGLGVGTLSSACTIYVSEQALDSKRGFLGTLFQVSITLFIAVCNIACYFIVGMQRDNKAAYCALTDDIKTRNMYVFLPGGVVSVLFFCFSFTLPESVRWKGRGDPAETAKLRSNTDALNVDYGDDPTSYTKQVVIGTVMAMALQLTGINAVMFYVTEFFKSAGFAEASLGGVFVMVWNFLTTLASPFLSDKLGRRALMIPCLFGLSISILLMDPIYSGLEGNTRSVLSFILLGVYILCFEAGPGCCFWVICTELFPEEISGKAFACINALQWTLTVTVTLIFVPLHDAMGNHAFLFFGIPGVLFAVFLMLCLPETKGKTKAEVTRELSQGWLVWGKSSPEIRFQKTVPGEIAKC